MCATSYYRKWENMDFNLALQFWDAVVEKPYLFQKDLPLTPSQAGTLTKIWRIASTSVIFRFPSLYDQLDVLYDSESHSIKCRSE